MNVTYMIYDVTIMDVTSTIFLPNCIEDNSKKKKGIKIKQ
jgi:hypothetical protein